MFLERLRNVFRAFQNSSSENTMSATPSNENFRSQTKISWSHEVNLLINCIGFSVGLGNLWRFPYEAFKYGGGAFLVPYVFFTFVITFPLYYMELLVGQYSHLDPISVWSFCSFFKGLGVTILLGVFTIQIYYNVIMAYGVFYLAQIFREVLPWSKCLDWWGADEDCFEMKKGVSLCKSRSNQLERNINCSNATESSSDQFWKIHVLGLSSGLDDVGIIKWDLALALLVSWIIVGGLAIMRHHTTFHTKFKTVYFTAIFPFVVLIFYFFYVIAMPGAMDGLVKLFIPTWSSLLEPEVWSEAIQSSLFSTGVGMGGLIIFGRQNDFRNRTSWCAFISTFVDLLAGVLAATVTFMVVGNLSYSYDLEFTETTLSGSGLVFITFPEAVLTTFSPHFWAFSFFSMFVCLAVDASVAVTETLALGLCVLCCPSRHREKPAVYLTSTVLFLAGLSCVTNGGAFLLNILDVYAGGLALMGTVLVEAVAFGWGYGVKQISRDVYRMKGSEPHMYYKICWVIIAPLSLIVIFLYNTPQFHLAPLYKTPYPAYANTLGWILVAIILLPTPIGMGIALFHHRENLSDAFKPDEIWLKAINLRMRENV